MAIDSAPVTAPAATGEKTTFATQFAPAASDAPHVVFATLKPADAVSTRLPSASESLVLVSVTAMGLLLVPTPVVGNATCAG